MNLDYDDKLQEAMEIYKILQIRRSLVSIQLIVNGFILNSHLCLLAPNYLDRNMEYMKGLLDKTIEIAETEQEEILEEGVVPDINDETRESLIIALLCLEDFYGNRAVEELSKQVTVQTSLQEFHEEIIVNSQIVSSCS